MKNQVPEVSLDKNRESKATALRSTIYSVGVGVFLALSVPEKSHADFWSDLRDSTIGKVIPKISKNDIEREFKKVIDNTVGRNGLGAIGTKIHDEMERFYDRVDTEADGLGRALKQAGRDLGNGAQFANEEIIEPITEFSGDVIQELGIKPLKLTFKEALRLRCRLEHGRRSDSSKDKNFDGVNDDYLECWNAGISAEVSTGWNGTTITVNDPTLGPIGIPIESESEREQREQEFNDYVKSSNDQMKSFLEELGAPENVVIESGFGIPDSFFDIPEFDLQDITREGGITIEGVVYPTIGEYQLSVIDNQIETSRRTIEELSAKGEPMGDVAYSFALFGAASLVPAGMLTDALAGLPVKSLVGLGKGVKLTIISTKFGKSVMTTFDLPTNSEESYYTALGAIGKDIITPEFTAGSIRVLVGVSDHRKNAQNTQRLLRLEEKRLEELLKKKQEAEIHLKEKPSSSLNLESLIGQEYTNQETPTQTIPREPEGPRYERGRGWIQAN